MGHINNNNGGETAVYNYVKRILKDIPGQTGFYYKRLDGSEIVAFNEDRIFYAASLIKIPILIEAFNRVRLGEMDFDKKYEVKNSDKAPSCGALSYMHDGLEVTFRDLCVLMIIHSDNTAANMLINILGMERINQTLIDREIYMTRLNRLLFDQDASEQGLENTAVLEDMAKLFEEMHNGRLISRKISIEMLNIFKMQRLNSKIPRLLPRGLSIAHKTGEDEGITHDIGIVYARKPFLIGFMSNNTDLVAMDNAISEISRFAYKRNCY